MTHPTTTLSKTRSRTGRRTARSLGLALTATAAATVTSIGLGLGPSPAQADPGDTNVPIGSSQLVQSEDLTSIQIPLDTHRVVLNRDGDFSPCLGESNPWTAVLPGAPRPVTGTWSRRGRDESLHEYITQAPTVADAKRYVRMLRALEISGCQQGRSPFDFHYGPPEASGIGSGYATWALSYTGDDPRPDGGVVVFRKGQNFGVVYMNGTFGSAEQTMESVAKVAVSRLVYSR